MSKFPSVRKHVKGYFFIRLHGKDHYLGKDKSAAYIKAKPLLAAYLVGQSISTSSSSPSSEMTIEEISIGFLLDEKKKYANSDHDTGSFGRCRLSIQLLIDDFGNQNPNNFGPRALKKLRDKLIESGLARSTINTRINIIRSCFRWAVENEFCSPEVYQALQAVKPLSPGRTAAKSEKKIRPVPMEIVEQTLPELPSMVADMVRLQLHSGMRSSEMLGLRACDLDMSRPIWRYSPDSHKGTWKGKERVVYMGPECQKVLKPYLERVGENKQRYLFSPKDSVEACKRKRRAERKTKVQPSQQNRAKPNPKCGPGDKYRRDSYRNAILRACQRLGIAPWFPHQLRHQAGTRAREVAGLDGSQHFLGHNHQKVSERYSEIRDTLGETVAAKIG